MAKNGEETEEKTKNESKANPGFGISSRTYYAAAIAVLIIGAALIGFMATGQQPIEGRVAANGTELKIATTPVATAAKGIASDYAPAAVSEMTPEPSATLSAGWRPNRLRCYSSSDCFVKDGYCRTRLLPSDLGDSIAAGKNCACVSQSCQIAG